MRNNFEFDFSLAIIVVVVDVIVAVVAVVVNIVSAFEALLFAGAVCMARSIYDKLDCVNFKNE